MTNNQYIDTSKHPYRVEIRNRDGTSTFGHFSNVRAAVRFGKWGSRGSLDFGLTCNGKMFSFDDKAHVSAIIAAQHPMVIQ